jgi:hypothetical protein
MNKLFKIKKKIECMKVSVGWLDRLASERVIEWHWNTVDGKSQRYENLKKYIHTYIHKHDLKVHDDGILMHLFTILTLPIGMFLSKETFRKKDCLHPQVESQLSWVKTIQLSGRRD